MNTISIEAGPRGAILHVNRSFIAANKRDGSTRPVYTLKPNGPHSKPIYAREVTWHGAARAVQSEEPLACGATAWIAIEPGNLLILDDPMTFCEAKKAVQ